jgi:PEP-CTERM motif
MKKLLLTGLALAGFTAGVFAQGGFLLDNSSTSYGLKDKAGNYIDGVNANFEVWIANTATVPANLLASGLAYNTAYGLLAGDNFSQVGGTLSVPIGTGQFSGPEVKAAGVSPAGSTVALALFVWTGSATTFSAAMAASNPAGFVAFTQATVDYTNPLLLPSGLANWPSDLTLTSVPEPSMFALAGLGGAALLIFRRRR